MVTEKDLKRGFFQLLFDVGPSACAHPVLQVLDAKPMKKVDGNPADNRFRLRLSDGMFHYSMCLTQSQIGDKAAADNLGSGYPVIKLMRYTLSKSERNTDKVPLVIIDYELLGRDLPVLGNPSPHSGFAKDFRGLSMNQNVKREEPMETVEVSGDQQDGNAPRSAFGRRPGAENVPQSNSGRDVPQGNFGQNSAAAGGGGGGGRPMGNITPIKLITPYVNKWRILGKVTAKEEIRVIKNTQRGEMRVFNFEVTDRDRDTIRIAAFNETADKFFNIIRKDMAYSIAGGSVRQANKKFNNTGHDYELTLRNDSEVSMCADEVAHVTGPVLKLNVVPLNRIAQHIGDNVDVIAVVDKVNDIQELTSKTGNSFTKRDFDLVDRSGSMIALTLWNERAREFDESFAGQVVGVKGALVREFNGTLTLSTASSTRVEFNLENQMATELYAWYENERPGMATTNLSRQNAGGGGAYGRDLRLISIAMGIGLGRTEEKGAYFNITGIISTLKSDGALYKSCGTDGCKKKVVETEDGSFRCEKCNLTLDKYKYVLLMQLEVSDATGSNWMTMFDENAVKLLGKSAEEVGALLDSNKTDEYNEVFNAVRFRPFTFRVRAKTEYFNEVERLKWTAYEVRPVDYDKYIEELTRAIDKLENM